MTVNLQIGQVINLRKEEIDLSLVTIGLGWDSVEKKQGSPGSSSDEGNAAHYDLDMDVVAFLCSDEGKVVNTGHDAQGHMTLVGGDVIFFGNPDHESGAIWLTGDNLTGMGDDDDEQIIVDLNRLPRRIAKVVLVVQIYKGIENNQTFGDTGGAFIRAADRRGKEVVHFGLSGNDSLEHCRSMLFAEIVRDGDGWNFNVLGKPFETDSFLELLKPFL